MNTIGRGETNLGEKERNLIREKDAEMTEGEMIGWIGNF